MSFLALLFALLIEQARPLAEHNPIHDGMGRYARWMQRTLDAGLHGHALSAWLLSVMGPALLACLVHWALLAWLGWPVAMLWSIVLLYPTLGFRQFSHHFTDIRDALDSGDETRARELLAQWKQVDASLLPRQEIVRHVIEHSVVAAHRHVFGVLAWFSVLAALGLGPAGAVLYRMSEYASRLWRAGGLLPDGSPQASEPLCRLSAQVWHWVDWVPARMTALSFAVVGNFEEAIDCWRTHAQQFPDDNDGVVLAATSGAVNVRLGGEGLRPQHALSDDDSLDSPSTPGREPELAHFRSIVGLVWRTVVMWLVLLALLTLARLLG